MTKPVESLEYSTFFPMKRLFLSITILISGLLAPASVWAATTDSSPLSLTIPRLGIYSFPAREPEDALTISGLLSPLKDGVGKLLDWPGASGTTLLYGKANGASWETPSYRHIFRNLSTLSPGDRAYVFYADAVFVYEVVSSQTVESGMLAALYFPKKNTPTLLLSTCWPIEKNDRRELVRAELVRRIDLR